MRGSLLLFVLASTCSLFGSCATEPALPEDSGELAADLERELDARAEALAAARRASVSPDLWDPWAACLETSAPAVLAARRRLAIARARSHAAGVPPAMFDGETVGTGSDRETELMLAFDLPALVGAGGAGAERARAEVEARRAEVELAAVIFRTQHDLERALAALAVARELEAGLAALDESCQPNAVRLDLLHERGWLAPDQVATVRTMLHHVGAMQHEQQAAVAVARGDVATLAGLRPDSPWLDDARASSLLAITHRTSDRTARPDPSALSLLDSHPELLRARVDYLGAEADVRVASAQQWPALLIGPKAMFTSDDLLWGGVLRLELPWPPAASAAVDAARSERNAARDDLVAALAAAQNRIAQQRTQLRAAEESLLEHAESLLESTELGLRAAHARFRADPQALQEWSMAIDQRSRALVALAAATERRLVATIDLSEALGPLAPDPEGAR